MYDKVLVPTDGSDHADRGVDYGMDLAAENDAQLHVLFVVDESVYGGTPALSSYEAFLEELEEQAEALTEDIVEDATERGIDTTLSVRRGVPHDTICHYADQEDIDVIVMGKRGAAGVESPHIGSVTNRVLRQAPVPVIPV
ncbi:universal stress protein [Haloarcula salinisoli]|uniref:Universal stress protein n=1 Tax=Haloarcula salinisoli TaxID=2487746 RepID=A0A8J7YJ95_9EURY|nr:universal stress protein [Halomicroarcula salinisoli]MBX0286269.1 universal stress protein [Halomicroarcula salinisoli]MBX0302243.1 universal stress protein [Halomicroarcula salinisoli]